MDPIVSNRIVSNIIVTNRIVSDRIVSYHKYIPAFDIYLGRIL